MLFRQKQTKLKLIPPINTLCYTQAVVIYKFINYMHYNPNNFIRIKAP